MMAQASRWLITSRGVVDARRYASRYEVPARRRATKQSRRQTNFDGRMPVIDDHRSLAGRGAGLASKLCSAGVSWGIAPATLLKT